MSRIVHVGLPAPLSSLLSLSLLLCFQLAIHHMVVGSAPAPTVWRRYVLTNPLPATSSYEHPHSVFSVRSISETTSRTVYFFQGLALWGADNIHRLSCKLCSLQRGRSSEWPDRRHRVSGCLVPKNFHPKISHRILRHMHGTLNVDGTKKTNCTIHREIARQIF
jgi:hypothetical protein